MFRSIPLAWACALVAGGVAGPVAGSSCPSRAWTSHTSVRAVTALAVDGETLWMASLFGGVLEWHTASAGGRIYTRTSHCLPDNEVLDIAVAPTGNKPAEVWTAGIFGAGVRRTYAGPRRRWDLLVGSNSGLADEFIQSVGITAGGDVWIGSFEHGAYRFDGKTWENFGPFSSGLNQTTVTSIESAGETVWFGTWGGAFRLSAGEFTRFTAGNTGTPPGFCQFAAPLPPDQLGLTAGVVDVRRVDPDTGVVWISNFDDGPCFNSSTSRFDGENWRTFSTFNSDIAADLVTGVTTAPDGREVIASAGGSQFFDPSDGSFTDIRFPNGDPLPSNDVERVGDTLWFADPHRGLVRWANGAMTVFDPPGLNTNLVQDLALVDDPEPGNEPTVWIANPRGAQRLSSGQWSAFDPETSPLAGSDVLAIARGTDGAIWFAPRARGISRFDGQTWTTFNTGNSGLESDVIGALAVDPASGDIWAAHQWETGAARFDGGAWTALPVGPDFGTNDLAVDRDGNVWFAGSTQVVRFDGVASEVLNDGLPSTNTWALAVGPGNEIYVGTAEGAAVMIDAATWTPLPKVNPNLNNIRALGVDHEGHLWAGAWDVGLAEFDGASWTVYTTADGLTNSRVHAIVFGAADTVWAGTEEGISVFDQNYRIPADLNGDGRVGRADLHLLILGWGKPGLTDLDGDGTTSRSDLTILLSHWGP